ncbi:MAG: 6-methylsalicylic acid synthase [Lasallia pustulata]|uniref:6-methylsalicylic acid synthase n=1 Tax=Lasallia pustulata TaxID=136370 RepID=A0A5M8PYY9_9LECA|nr:MAG: 6-methylsalicylic acid synthase [Lasallia pustulata]
MEAKIEQGLYDPSTSPDSDDSASRETSPNQRGTPATNISNFAFSNDVAVVGMACRVAGGNNSPEQLWQSILDKKDASGEIPSMRWEPYLRRDVRNAKEISKTTSKGYFLDKLEDFDAAFFGISPKEAEQMDPQQRLSLEVTWEALENAGIAPQSLSGSDTAVFMGVNSDDYSKLLLEDLPGVEAWMGIGTAYCGIPNRISYHLNLMGPSTAVDAACASSLVAIHHGRQAILQGESKVAIVGGVNALCGPGLTRVLDKAGAISPDGSCLSFDEDAHGYGRGEGAAVVILKRMPDAIADGDNIIAVLKGSAVAQDGRTNGIMAPNAKAQELVARQALSAGGVDPLTVSYVEAHATSTPLGDPTEVSAIANVYGVGRPEDKPVFIGSVKPNVGHLEAGAGAVGFIKAILALNKGILPPQTNLKKLNSNIKWKEIGVKVVQDAAEWPTSDGPPRAAICSYGYGGTVSHTVIEGYSRDNGYASETDEADVNSSSSEILVLSAPQEKRLAAQAATHALWASSIGKDHDLRTIAATLATRRGHHDYRAALVVDGHQDAASSLNAFVNGSATEWATHDRVLDSNVSKDVAWVFSGHGAQWNEMGQELLQNTVFYEAVAALDHIVQAEMGFSAVTALESGEFESSDKIQVLTYVMQTGLTAILKSKGLQPQAIIGHSVGEIAASVAAGALKPEEGALLVCRRANLYSRVMGLGSMIFVNSPFSDISQELSGRADIVTAIDSSPSSCVVSGTANAIKEFKEILSARGIKTSQVKTDVAFHSPMLKQLVAPLYQDLKGSLSPRSPTVMLYSTSNPNPRSKGLRDVKYWANNMVSPVLLTSAIEAAADDGLRLFLEISTHPIISHSIRETLMSKGIEDFSVIFTMSRMKRAEKSILLSIAQLYCKGADVNWSKQVGRKWASEMPTTTWSHKPVWRKVETGELTTGTVHDVENHTLLGQRSPIAGTNIILYTTKLDNNTKPFPGNHPLHGTEIVPAAALVNTFVHATGARVLSNIILHVPVAISAPRDVQIVVQQDQVRIASRLIQSKSKTLDETSWVTHTTGKWTAEEPSVAAEDLTFDVPAIKARIGVKLADNFSIDYLEKVGVSAMGFPWTVTEHYGNLKEMIAKIDVAPDLPEGSVLPWDAHSWAPILDAATSVGSTIFFNEPRLRMPAHINRVEIHDDSPPPKTGYLYVTEATSTGLAVDVCVLNDDGTLLAKFVSMRFSEIEGTPDTNGSIESLVHQMAWPPASFTEKPLPMNQVVLISDDPQTVESRTANLSSKVKSVVKLTHASDLGSHNMSAVLKSKGTMVVYAPGQVQSVDDVPKAAELFISELLHIVKFVAQSSLLVKVFVLTDKVFAGETSTALAQAPLQGLCRIIASEQPDLWGALIDTEDPSFPVQAIKYVQGQDVVRISDGVPRIARLRPMPREQLYGVTNRKTLLPRSEGTYLVTGGIGALGLEVAEFLVEKGARRLILLSRRGLPPRKNWNRVSDSFTNVVEKIKRLEDLGATVHVVSIDIGANDGAEKLSSTLEVLSLPPILGVVHAAGVLEDQLVLETTTESFSRVLSPKLSGALALHSLFPPQSLEFFVLFSSCGQLFGFPGQSSYASGNAFLDTLATHRRNMGDNAVAFQWTSWRGMGMAASTDFINAELESKGITDLIHDEAFRAWEYLAKYNIDHGVVLRSLTFDEGETLPAPILNDIAIRRAGTGPVSSTAASSDGSTPTSGPELKAYLDSKIRECVASVLHLSSSEEVDSRAALSDLGVDSVMTVTLRKQLQSTLKVNVPPTLTWSHPTVGHLVSWYTEKLGETA